MLFDPGYALEILPRLLEGAIVTVQATFAGMALALCGGLLLAILRMARNPWISRSAALYMDLIRSTPLLIQLFFLFYILPRYVPAVDPLLTGIVALGLHYSTYTSEVYRGGIESVPRGQWEASTALGFGSVTTWTRVVIPQAVPPVIPALGNYLISMFKDSALLATITVLELFGTALYLGAQTYRYFEPLIIVGLIYLLLSYPSSLAIRRLERRFGSAAPSR